MSIDDRRGVLRFDEFELDGDTLELRRAGESVPLQPQPARLLWLLASNPERMIRREDICEHLWPEDATIQLDHGLHAAIRHIRVALGESAETPRRIHTYPRRGYKFSGQVTTVGAGRRPLLRPLRALVARLARRRVRTVATLLAGLVVMIFSYLAVSGVNPPVTPSPQPARVRPVTVTPLAVAEPGERNAELAARLRETILAELSSMADVRVVPEPPGDARRGGGPGGGTVETAAELLLVFAVRSSGSEFGVSWQLVSPRDMTPLWTGQRRITEADEGSCRQLAERIGNALRSVASLPLG